MHKIFIPSPNVVKLQVSNLISVSFRHHFLLCSRAEHVKLVVCFLERLLLLATAATVTLSTRNIRTRQDVGVTDSC